MTHPVIELKMTPDCLKSPGGIPFYATDGSAAMDLKACLKEPLDLFPCVSEIVHTGVRVNINDKGIVAILASRSGLYAKHGVRVGQGIGTIDSDYQGEIKVILTNDSSETYTVQPGDRIAQLMFVPVLQANLMLVNEFSSETKRGDGGFGHTGR